MARIRTIKPEFWTSEQVMECSPLARLLFIGMWNFADDLGRLSLAPKTLKAQIFPGDEIAVENVRGMIQELSTNGLVLLYEVDGKEFLQITGWQHQRIDKPQPGKCPAPRNGFKPAEKPNTSNSPDADRGSFADHSKNGRGMIVDGKEGKGEELKGSDRSTSLRSVGARERAPARRATRLAADAEPNERQIADAFAAGLSRSQIDQQWARMRDWSASSPKGACLDWEARWRNWIAGPPQSTGPPQRGQRPQGFETLLYDQQDNRHELDADPGFDLDLSATRAH